MTLHISFNPAGKNDDNYCEADVDEIFQKVPKSKLTDPSIKNWCRIQPLRYDHVGGAMATYTDKTNGDTVMMIGGETVTFEILEPQYFGSWVACSFEQNISFFVKNHKSEKKSYL